MLETLKKKSQKSHVIRAIVALVALIAILVWTKFAIFDVITGPTKMDITADPDSYAGKYVTIDADFFLTDYVEHTTTTTRKYGGSSTSVDGNSYIAFQNVYEDGAESSTWYFYSVYFRKGDQVGMNTMMDDTWDYWSDETGLVAPPEPMKVTGTWTKMEPQMERYYRETLAEMGIEESEYDVFYFYNIETDKLGGQYYIFFWVLMAVSLGLLIFFIMNVAGFFGNGYAANINKYLQNNSLVSMSNIESDFAAAHVIGGNTWVGKLWTIYIRGTKAQIITNKDLVWGYYFRRTGRNSVSEMRLFTKEKKMIGIGMSEDQTHEALEYYAAEQPQIIVGYTKELENAYNKTFADFLELRYNPAMRENSADPYFRE